MYSADVTQHLLVGYLQLAHKGLPKILFKGRYSIASTRLGSVSKTHRLKTIMGFDSTCGPCSWSRNFLECVCIANKRHSYRGGSEPLASRGFPP